MRESLNRIRKEKTALLLFCIIFLGAALRFLYIDKLPPSLNWDETSHGYNAYSILTSGKDEWGVRFPIIFKAYGDYKLPVYIYLTALSEALFGLTVFSVRFPSIISGVFLIIFTYLLGRKLLTSKIAIIAALLTAIEPWSLFLSRGAFEANMAQTLTVAGIYFFLKGLERNRYLSLSALLLGLSLWTYNSERIFVPLILISLILIYQDKLKVYLKHQREVLVISSLLYLLLFIPMCWQLAHSAGQARYSKVAILDTGAINRLNELRNNTNLPPIAAKLLYNKVTIFTKTFTVNWVSHYSPQFLFLKGGSQYQFNIPDTGLIYPVDAIFFLIGSLYIIFLSVKKDRKAVLLFLWMLLAPIPSALTREAPQTLRDITFLPLPMLLTALGLELFFSKVSSFRSKKFAAGVKFVVLIVYIFLLVLSVEHYLIDYWQSYRTKYSFAWQYGYPEAVEYARDNYAVYDKIIVTKKYGEPHIFFLFYWPWNPERYRLDSNLIRFERSDWFWVDAYDKFYFVNDWQIPTASDHDFVLEHGDKFSCDLISCLLITSPNNHPPDWHLVRSVNFLDGNPAFEIYSNK